jgi:hypothetical protein
LKPSQLASPHNTATLVTLQKASLCIQELRLSPLG